MMVLFRVLRPMSQLRFTAANVAAFGSMALIEGLAALFAHRSAGLSSDGWNIRARNSAFRLGHQALRKDLSGVVLFPILPPCPSVPTVLIVRLFFQHRKS